MRLESITGTKGKPPIVDARGLTIAQMFQILNFFREEKVRPRRKFFSPEAISHQHYEVTDAEIPKRVQEINRRLSKRNIKAQFFFVQEYGITADAFESEAIAENNRDLTPEPMKSNISRPAHLTANRKPAH